MGKRLLCLLLVLHSVVAFSKRDEERACPSFLKPQQWRAFLKTPGASDMLIGAESIAPLTFESLKTFCRRVAGGFTFEGQTVTENTPLETALFEKDPDREVAQVRIFFKGRAEPIASRLQSGARNHIDFSTAVDLINEVIVIAARSQLFYDSIERVEFTHSHPAPEFIVVVAGEETLVSLPLNEDDIEAGKELLKAVRKLTPNAKVRIRAVTPSGVTYSLDMP